MTNEGVTYRVLQLIVIWYPIPSSGAQTMYATGQPRELGCSSPVLILIAVLII